MKLTNLTIGFENCEYMTFDGTCIHGFCVEDIEKSIRRTAINSIDILYIPHIVAIEISKSGNLPYKSFGFLDGKQKFNRIKEYRDIAFIEFNLKDHNDEIIHFKYYPVWNGEFENEHQIVYESLNNNLYIFISDRKRFEDIFDREYIDSNSFVI